MFQRRSKQERGIDKNRDNRSSDFRGVLGGYLLHLVLRRQELTHRGRGGNRR